MIVHPGHCHKPGKGKWRQTHSQLKRTGWKNTPCITNSLVRSTMAEDKILKLVWDLKREVSFIFSISIGWVNGRVFSWDTYAQFLLLPASILPFWIWLPWEMPQLGWNILAPLTSLPAQGAQDSDSALWADGVLDCDCTFRPALPLVLLINFFLLSFLYASFISPCSNVSKKCQ